MTCDKVLSALATGGAIARWRARRHVARCHQCAEAQSRLHEIARDLAEAPPLTAAQRALWTAAGIEPTTLRRTPLWVYPAGLAAALVLVGVIGLKLWGPQFGGRDDGPRVVKNNPRPPALSPDERSERGTLAQDMLAQVDRLDHELAELRRAADLLDVRKDADALWQRYAPRKRSTL